MKKVLLLLLVCTLLALTGCAGKTTITKEPYKQVEVDNSRILNGSIDEVWHAAITGLSKTFFVLDNIERSSQIITLSFALDDPEPYLDCGIITVVTEGGMTGQGTYTFPSTRKYVTLTIADGSPHSKPATRTNTLSGRMNLVFTELSKNQVKIATNIRFILDGKLEGVRFVPIGFQGIFQPYTETFSDSCNTGQPSDKCTSTNKLEQLVLDRIEQELTHKTQE